MPLAAGPQQPRRCSRGPRARRMPGAAARSAGRAHGRFGTVYRACPHRRLRRRPRAPSRRVRGSRSRTPAGGRRAARGARAHGCDRPRAAGEPWDPGQRERERRARGRRPQRDRLPRRARPTGPRPCRCRHQRRRPAAGLADRRAHEPHPGHRPAARARRPERYYPTGCAQLRAPGPERPPRGRALLELARQRGAARVALVFDAGRLRPRARRPARRPRLRRDGPAPCASEEYRGDVEEIRRRRAAQLAEGARTRSSTRGSRARHAAGCWPRSRAPAGHARLRERRAAGARPVPLRSRRRPRRARRSAPCRRRRADGRRGVGCSSGWRARRARRRRGPKLCTATRPCASCSTPSREGGRQPRARDARAGTRVRARAVGARDYRCAATETSTRRWLSCGLARRALRVVRSWAMKAD